MTFWKPASSTPRPHSFLRGSAHTTAQLLMMALLGVLLVLRFDPALHLATPAGLLWRNALPVMLLALVLYALLGRVVFSAWLTFVVVRMTFVVNAIKQRDMNAPLLPGDWVLKDQLLHHLNFFSRYAGGIKSLALATLVFLIVSVALWRLERRLPRPSLPTRVAWFLFAVLVLYTMLRGERPWRDVYSDAALPGFQLWDPIASVQSTGLMASLVRMTQESRIRIPKADDSVVIDFAKGHRESLASRADRAIPSPLPDIVVVQSEAFFDPAILKGIQPGDFDPNFERLSQTGITGYLTTPAYGGGTIRTEFETLTGYPMQAFPSIVYPYYGLARRWMPTVPRRLLAFGYSTTLFHPFRADFWNRQEVMPMLGFQHSYYDKDFAGAAHAGLYVSDQALFDFVLAHLSDAPHVPSYSMIITMENHGPWNQDVVGLPKGLAGRVLPPGLSAEASQEMTYYLSHLINGDAALGAFVQKLMARPRWTILLFYGDHLPSLNKAFEEVGFDNGDEYGNQHTRYMLISNRPLKPRSLNLDAYALPGLLLDTAGLPEDGYMAFDGAIREAETKDVPQQLPHYGQVSFDAARMEVRCRHRLKLDGTCMAHRPQLPPPLAGH